MSQIRKASAGYKLQALGTGRLRKLRKPQLRKKALIGRPDQLNLITQCQKTHFTRLSMIWWALFWMDGHKNLCRFYLSLCTVCTFYRQPIFTAKGICPNSILDWNYYPIIDSKNQVKMYEGYKKKSRIFFDKDSQKWKIVPETSYSEKNIVVERS